jgi:hypothetical protein
MKTTEEQRDEWQRLSDENNLDQWTVTEQAGDEDDKEATIWAGDGHLCIGDFYHAVDAKTAATARNALPLLLRDVAELTTELTTWKHREEMSTGLYAAAEKARIEERTARAADAEERDAAVKQLTEERDALQENERRITRERTAQAQDIDRLRERAEKAEDKIGRVCLRVSFNPDTGADAIVDAIDRLVMYTSRIRRTAIDLLGALDGNGAWDATEVRGALSADESDAGRALLAERDRLREENAQYALALA